MADIPSQFLNDSSDVCWYHDASLFAEFNWITNVGSFCALWVLWCVLSLLRRLLTAIDQGKDPNIIFALNCSQSCYLWISLQTNSLNYEEAADVCTSSSSQCFFSLATCCRLASQPFETFFDWHCIKVGLWDSTIELGSHKAIMIILDGFESLCMVGWWQHCLGQQF